MALNLVGILYPIFSNIICRSASLFNAEYHLYEQRHIWRVKMYHYMWFNENLHVSKYNISRDAILSVRFICGRRATTKSRNNEVYMMDNYHTVVFCEQVNFNKNVNIFLS